MRVGFQTLEIPLLRALTLCAEGQGLEDQERARVWPASLQAVAVKQP